MTKPGKGPAISACYDCASMFCLLLLVVLVAYFIVFAVHALSLHWIEPAFDPSAYAAGQVEGLPQRSLPELGYGFWYVVHHVPLWGLLLALWWYWRRCWAMPSTNQMAVDCLRCGLSLCGGYFALLAMMELQQAWRELIQFSFGLGMYGFPGPDGNFTSVSIPGGLQVVVGLGLLLAAGPLSSWWFRVMVVPESAELLSSPQRQGVP